ncbi:MAG: cysteine hydrolase [Acidimicrobiia bacterium]
MPVDLAALIDPSHTAVLTMELQRGVVGAESPLRELADAATAANVVTNTAKVVHAARAAGTHVVHCTFEARADRTGAVANAPFLRMLAKRDPHLLPGSSAAALVPELGPEPSDVICSRRHGLTPFPGTDLDPTLRNLGVRTVIATGVSVNVGILGMVMGAVDRGYDVVVVTDAVAGIPAAYAQAVVDNTLSALATRATSDEIVAVWAS